MKAMRASGDMNEWMEQKRAEFDALPEDDWSKKSLDDIQKITRSVYLVACYNDL
jgi:hypothetical protein